MVIVDSWYMFDMFAADAGLDPANHGGRLRGSTPIHPSKERNYVCLTDTIYTSTCEDFRCGRDKDADTANRLRRHSTAISKTLTLSIRKCNPRWLDLMTIYIQRCAKVSKIE